LRTPLFPFIFRSLHNATKRQNTTPLSVTSTLHKASLSSHTQLISSLADHEALIRCPLHCMKLILWINLGLFSICFLKGCVRIIRQLGFNCPNYKYNRIKRIQFLSAVSQVFWGVTPSRLVSSCQGFLGSCLARTAWPWRNWDLFETIATLYQSAQSNIPDGILKSSLKIKSLSIRNYSTGNNWPIIRYLQLLEKFQILSLAVLCLEGVYETMIY